MNETFVRQFLAGMNPLQQTVTVLGMRCPVLGVVHDAPYRSIREATLPVLYVPIYSADNAGALRPIKSATFMVRTSDANPLTMASRLRNEFPRARSEFRVANIRPERDLVDAQTVRERLLAMLAVFFAGVALLLAGIGLYGVLDYSVLQRRREIGIRIAVGARTFDIVQCVSVDGLAMVLAGAIGGLATGMASVRYIESLLYQVRLTDFAVLTLPSITILAAALFATLPAVIRAIRIDPVKMLRAD